MTMTRILFIITTVILLFCSAGNASAKGFSINLKTDKTDTSSYTLHGWKWGERISIDTVKASKGKVVFKSKKDLACGSYVISELSGRKIVGKFSVF